jgi:hypothetical protein
MNVYVFVGPSLPVEQARRYLDATYLPPVQQGDVLRLLGERPDVIGIVDGYFNTVPAVWHKELLEALSSGVHVFGAASMGALRAAELYPYGMVGVGEIFEWYRSGELEDDDEVALAHESAEAGYRPTSIAMVDVRDACRAAVVAGVISAALAERLTTIAKQLYYADRTYPCILGAAHWDGEGVALDAMERFVATYGPTLKQRDAIALLERIAAFVAERPTPLQVPYRVEQTVFLDALRQEVEQARAVGGEAPTVAPDQVLRGGETMAVVRKKVLLRLLARREAAHLGLQVTSDELQARADRFRADYGLLTAADTTRWLAAEGLTPHAFTALVRDFCLVDKLEQLYERQVDHGVADQIRVSTARARSARGAP